MCSCHDIAEILLKLVFTPTNQLNLISAFHIIFLFFIFTYQSKGSFFILRLSLGKYPGGYLKL